MIKINLLRRAGSATVIAPVGTGVYNLGGALSRDDQKVAVGKLIVIILAPLALFGWERYQLTEKREALEVVRSEVAKLEQQKGAFQGTAPMVQKYTEDKKRIEKQLDVLKVLAKDRLRPVKTLDMIQTLVPKGVWLKKVDMLGDKVVMSGFASTDEGVPELIKGIETSSYFSGLKVNGINQDDSLKGAQKKFDIEFMIGKKE